MKHQGLDHLAIAVPDTEAALKIWRDQFGFKVLYNEDVNNATVPSRTSTWATPSCNSCNRSRPIIRSRRGSRRTVRACTTFVSRWRMWVRHR